MNNFDLLRVAFYITRNNQRHRQVIALNGFFVNALSSIGVTRSNVPKWVQGKVDEWEHFNPHLPITKQIKGLIILSLVTELGGDNSAFYVAAGA